MNVWTCPNCESWARTVNTKIPYHRCGGLAGLLTPLVRHGTRARVASVERGDYVGSERVQVDALGRPIMAVITERDDGRDCTVYAPVAREVEV